MVVFIVDPEYLENFRNRFHEEEPSWTGYDKEKPQPRHISLERDINFHRHGQCWLNTQHMHDSPPFRQQLAGQSRNCGRCNAVTAEHEGHRWLWCRHPLCRSCLLATARDFLDCLEHPDCFRTLNESLREHHELENSPEKDWCSDISYLRWEGVAPPWYMEEVDWFRARVKEWDQANALAGLSSKCCGTLIELGDPYQRCLPRALSEKVLLRTKWMNTPPWLRKYCAFPDCGEFLSDFCQYPIYDPPADQATAPRMYGPQAPRRVYCLSCERDSEIPPDDDPDAPVLAEAQKKFPWLPAGHRMLLPAGTHRSEERRVGKECMPVCRSRWSPYH